VYWSIAVICGDDVARGREVGTRGRDVNDAVEGCVSVIIHMERLVGKLHMDGN